MTETNDRSEMLAMAAKVERVATMMRKLLPSIPFCDPDVKDLEEGAAALRAAASAEPVACPACDHVHLKGALCIGVAVGAGGGVVKLKEPVACDCGATCQDVDRCRYDASWPEAPGGPIE